MENTCKIKKLEEIMDRLRSPDGCPWDREQTLESLKPMLVEEAYEVLSAVDKKDKDNLKEELGDLLLQIVFYSRIAKENGWFTLDDVIDGISEKLIRRHPHVFGDKKLDSAEKVLKQWEEIKSEEKKNEKRESILDGLPEAIPSVYEAYQIGERVNRVGFDWNDIKDVVGKLEEELFELKKALEENERDLVEEEVGDIFFTLVNICRFLKRDPETLFKRGNKKFIKRFKKLESLAEKKGFELKNLDIEQLENLWQEVKDER